MRVRLRRFEPLFTRGKNPSCSRLDGDLHVRVAGIDQQLPMLIRSQKLQVCDREVLFDEPCRTALGSSVNLRDDRKSAVGFKDAKQFPKVGRQIRPPEMSLGRDNKIEGVRANGN